MQIQVNFGDIDNSPALRDHAEQAVQSTLTHVADRVTRVEIHLRDDKQKRQGPDDKRCTIEARPAGGQPIVAEAKAGDIYDAVDDAAGRVGRAVQRWFDRREG